MNAIAHRVARRHTAAFFNVGDIILFGKYKNKKGKIVRFGKNDKGQPTVEIEPIPKGRKKNKTMGLMKIWSLTKKEEALAEKAMKEEKAKKAMALRVAARHLKARGVGVGKTEAKRNIRVHRYRDSLHIWDLTNAGKRGKKVRWMSLGTTYSYTGDPQKWLANMSYFALDYGDYGQFKRFIEDVMVDFPGEISMDEGQARGIDILPAETKVYKMEWSIGTTNMRLEASPLKFMVVDSYLHEPGPRARPDAEPFRQDTKHWPVKKTDAQKFYGWLVANENKVKRMSMQDLKKLWRDIGVRYDSH